MKKILSILTFLLLASSVYAVEYVTVPTSPAAGYGLVSTSNGGYVASSTVFSGSGTSSINATSSTSTSGILTQDAYNIFNNLINPKKTSSILSTAASYATSTYLFDNFSVFNNVRWVHSSGGTMTFSNGVMSVTTPSGNDTIATRALWTAILSGYNYISFDVNFNGNTFLVAGDTPTLSFNQAGGDRGIVLTRFATNGVNGWQTVYIPLSYFTSNEDSSTSSPGTGTTLDPTAIVSNFKLRVFENTAGKILSIRNVVLTDTTHTLQQDFTQPDLNNTPKPGNSIFLIQSVDFMKISKDNATSQYTSTQMLQAVSAVKTLNLTHIAIDVPYDDYTAYSPSVTPNYASNWASAVRKDGYNVFWRQHWNSWEGDYTSSGFSKATSTGTVGGGPGIPLGTVSGVLAGTDTTSYLYKTYNYILTHASQYAPGDIFSPVAEPENGGILGVTTCYNFSGGGNSVTNDCQFTSAEQFRVFLRDSITVANAAFSKIGLKGRIYVGYYGNSAFIVNGDGGGTPHGVLDDRTVDAMSTVAMDDYPNPVSGINTDLTTFQGIYGFRPFMLSEFGTINDTTTTTKAFSLNTVVNALKSLGSTVGFNYWSATGGANENLIDPTTYAPIGAYAALQAQNTSGTFVNVATALGNIYGINPVSIVNAYPPIAGMVLQAVTATSAIWTATSSLGISTGGAGATTSPAGADTQVQFNNGGVFGAASGLTYNSSTPALILTNAKENITSNLASNALTITQNGNSGTSDSGGGAFNVNCSGNSGYCINFYSKQANAGEQLRLMKDATSSTTVNGPQTIDNTSTSLTVASTAGFTASGFILVENSASIGENNNTAIMQYSSVTGTSFVGSAGTLYPMTTNISLINGAVVKQVTTTDTHYAFHITDYSDQFANAKIKIFSPHVDQEYGALGYNNSIGQGQFGQDIPVAEQTSVLDSLDVYRFLGRNDANSGFNPAMIYSRPGNGEGMVGIGFQNKTAPTTLSAHLHIINSTNFGDASAAALVGLKVQGATNQTADLIQVVNSAGNVLSTFKSNGFLGIGTTTPVAQFQVTSSTTNATSTVEIGKAGQTKGSCMIMYDTTGATQYVSIKGGLLNVSTVACN